MRNRYPWLCFGWYSLFRRRSRLSYIQKLILTLLNLTSEILCFLIYSLIFIEKQFHSQPFVLRRSKAVSWKPSLKPALRALCCFCQRKAGILHCPFLSLQHFLMVFRMASAFLWKTCRRLRLLQADSRVKLDEDTALASKN